MTDQPTDLEPNVQWFGPFWVRSARPKDLVAEGDAVHVGLSSTEVILWRHGREEDPLAPWPRAEVRALPNKYGFGRMELGRAVVLVHGSPAVYDQLHATLSSGVSIADEARSLFGAGREIVVRAYPGRTQADAGALFQLDATEAAKYGYTPTSQSWGEGRPGIARVLTLGLASMAIRPKGFLTVTDVKAAASPGAVVPAVPETAAEMKTCPMCAEEVRAAAKICRFCRYEFTEGGGVEGASG